MEIDAILRKKLKLRKKLMVIRDILLILLACLFILAAFMYTIDVNNAIGDGMKNIRFGLFSFALIISGTAIIIAVYSGRKKHIFKMFLQKTGLPSKSKK